MNRTLAPTPPTSTCATDLATLNIPMQHTGPSPSPYTFLHPPMESDELGRLGPYRVLRLLGKGGMGMVFLAEDLSLRRPVALKVMRPDFIRDKAKDESRFLREARTMAAIKHPRLATLYHADKVGDTIYLAMELLQGETLEAWEERTARADLADVLRIARDLALGLSAIHEAGLVHRDLKPSNLWLESPSGRVKILDFGLAREINDNTQITEAGFLIGTPAFLSPEQARGKPASHLSDLFSLGCVLYHLCTKRLPFQAENNLDQLAAIAGDEPPPPQNFNAKLPEPLADLILQLLAKDPGRRPQSAAEVAERLQQIKKKGPGRPRKKSSARLNIRKFKPTFLQKHGFKLLLGAGVAVFLSAGVLAAIFILPRFAAARQDGQKDAAVAQKPAAAVFLNQLKPARTKNWPFQPPGFNGVVVNGKLSPHGIFMHPAPVGDTASVSYQLDKKYRNFTGRVSLNDSGEPNVDPVTFRIFADDKQIWASNPIVSHGNAQEFAVDVKNVTWLRIQVESAGDPRGAHTVWFEPRLE